MAGAGKIVSYNVPSSAQKGSTVTVSVTIKNVGVSSDTFSMQFSFDGTGTILKKPGDTPWYNLAPGQSVTTSISFTMPNRNITFSGILGMSPPDWWTQDYFFDIPITATTPPPQTPTALTPILIASPLLLGGIIAYYGTRKGGGMGIAV